MPTMTVRHICVQMCHVVTNIKMVKVMELDSVEYAGEKHHLYFAFSYIFTLSDLYTMIVLACLVLRLTTGLCFQRIVHS